MSTFLYHRITPSRISSSTSIDQSINQSINQSVNHLSVLPPQDPPQPRRGSVFCRRRPHRGLGVQPLRRRLFDRRLRRRRRPGTRLQRHADVRTQRSVCEWPSICLPVCLMVKQNERSISLSVCTSVCLSVCMSVRVFLSGFRPVRLSVGLFLCMSV